MEVVHNMNGETEQIRNIDYEALRNQKHNVMNRIILIFLIVGYLFFLLSPLLFHQHPEKQLTNLYEDVKFKNGNLRVESWTYSEKQNISEVCCAFTDYGDEEKIQFSAAANFSYASKNTVSLDTEIRYIDSGYFVIVIKNLPEDWYCVALYIKYSDTDETLAISNEQRIESNTEITESQSEYNDNETSVYTCIDDVEKVNSIEKQDDKTYKITHCQRSIEQDEKLINKYKDEVKELNNQIKDYQYQIQQLESEMALQTSSEQEKSQEKIDEYNRYINDNNNKIVNINSQLELLENDANEYKIIIKNLNGITDETIKPIENSEQTTDK